jgi:hypothetical protein
VRDTLSIWSSDGRGSLQFTDPRVEEGTEFFWCTATLELDGEASSVELWMIPAHRRIWLRDLDDIARNVSGWDGVKEWESEHAELRISFSNDGSGTITAHVLIVWPPDYEQSREGTLTFTGEDLTRLRREMPSFLRLDDPRV